LRAEIIAGARTLMEQRGTEEAVTLRALAREIGVTAPAIYGHFANRESIVEAVVLDAFNEFARSTLGGLAQADSPLEGVRAFCLAYVVYAHDHPATYRIVFTRPQPGRLPVVAKQSAELFERLLEAVAACAPDQFPAPATAFHPAVMVWTGLHGLATLPPSHPRFPWPEVDRMVDALVRAHVGPAEV